MDTVCRCCLNLNASNAVFDQCERFKISFAEMLSNCSMIPVSTNDRLPAFICDNCIINMRIAYAFKTVCFDSYSKLVSSINTEDVSEISKIMTNEVTVHDSLTPRSSPNKHRRVKKKKITMKPKVKDIESSPSIEYLIRKSLNTRNYEHCNSEPSCINKIYLETRYIKWKYTPKNTSLKKKKTKSASSKKGKKKRKTSTLIECLVCGKQLTDKNSFKKHAISHFNELKLVAENQNAQDSIKSEDEKISANRINGLLDRFNSLQLKAEKTEQAQGEE